MKQLTLSALALLFSVSAITHAAVAAPGREVAAAVPPSAQVIFRAGSQPSFNGSADNFTGNARVDPMFPAGQRASYSGGQVSFEPGARSAWHTHPAGQYLIVTAGTGWTQAAGGPVEEIRAGDVVWCPPGVKHWHGASPASAMSHIALTGSVDGKSVQWLEQVSEQQYRR